MSEAPDPLETELSAMRPHEVSPGLRRRIAERLADPPQARRRTWRILRIALAAGLAAACLLAVVSRRAGDPGQGSDPRPVVVHPRPASPVEVDVDDSEPTLVAYERALARSPDDLLALLNRHAAGDRGARPEPAPIGAFTRPDASLRTLLGEH